MDTLSQTPKLSCSSSKGMPKAFAMSSLQYPKVHVSEDLAPHWQDVSQSLLEAEFKYQYETVTKYRALMYSS